MSSVRPFCVHTPHHITAFFRPIPGPKPEMTGSIGAGLAVEPRARLCYPGASLKGEPPWYQSPPHAKKVASKLKVDLSGARIVHPLPPGRGYAVSAASAMLGALASAVIGKVLVTKAYVIAHSVEVEMNTGLGDVSAIASCGIGLVIRYTPGPPGVAEVDCIPLDPGYAIVAGELGEMATRDLIALYSSGAAWDETSRSIGRLFRNPSIDVFLEEAERLTRVLSLDRKLLGLNAVDLLRGLDVASFYVKKKLLIVIAGYKSSREVADTLMEKGFTVRLLSPSTSPPGIAEI